MTHDKLKAFPADRVRLFGGPFHHRFNLNRNYVASLKEDNLLQNFYLEAGLRSGIFRCTNAATIDTGEGWHWGWESPTCQLRGHFLGHWLSAAARIFASTADADVKLKLDRVVDGLARCQKKNGGEWAGSIPEKYLDWTAQGMPTWAPHYALHKTLMGLFDAYSLAGNKQALDVMVNWAKWFHKWTGKFTREKMDDILDVETGGMMESWANLYGVTGAQEHLELVHRYERRRLFEPLLAGKDVMTNLHANTTVPEAHGAARAYEVTGDERWRKIAEAYWKCAVTDRGYYCTGGQTCGEIWSPPFQLSARLGEKTQEHCVVYNMIRLAEYLLRWTGGAEYADYIERNLYNGVLAQQHPGTGMITYFLPLQAGGQKRWGSPTNDFWCCHGSLVQAHTLHNSYAWYEDADGLVLAQYIPSEVRWDGPAGPVTAHLWFEPETGHSWKGVAQTGSARRPTRWLVELAVKSEKEAEFTLKIRLPWWLAGKAAVTVNGREEKLESVPGSFHALRRKWKEDKVRIELPKGLWTCPLPDAPDTVAFMDGPSVLAGICDEGLTLRGDKNDPDSILMPDKEREWGSWLSGYRTREQERNIRFVPLHDVADERYTVYFPVRPYIAG